MLGNSKWVSLVVAAALGGCGDNIVGNLGPAVSDLELTTMEDVPISRGVPVVDPAAGELTITLGQPAHGAVVLAGLDFTYTPAADYHGPDSFSVTVSDGVADAEGTVSITVTPVNDAPVGVPDTFATGEDVALELAPSAVLANDIDVDGDVLTVTDVGNPTNGTVAIVAGEIVYTPAADFNGDGTFEYTVSDGTDTDIVVVTVNVGGSNDPPVAADDALATDEDVPLVVAGSVLTANDTDPENQTLTVTAVTAGTNGTVALDAGEITFTPDANFNGTATFDYTVSDGTDTDTATVTVTVNPINDAPIAVDDTATTDEDTAVVVTVATMLANDTDVENDTLTITGAGNADNGAIAIDGTTGDVTFTPTLNFNGAASFEYTVSDGTDTATGTVNITVAPVNDPPVAVDDTAVTAEDTDLVLTSADLTANDLDIDGDALTVTAATNPSNGTLTFAGGTTTFTPAPNYSGPASFDYTVGDGTLTDTGTVNITVTAVNDAPVADDDAFDTDEDTALVVTSAQLTANDSDAEGDPLTVTAVGSPVNGTVALAAGTITFTPDADFAGAASFEYTVADGNGGEDTGLVAVTVAPINDAPVAVDDTADADSAGINTYPTSQFLANDTDVDGPALSITAVSNPTPGTATVTLDGTTITFVPLPGSSGAASFDYTVSDGTLTDTGTVNVTVVDGNICGDGAILGAEQCDDGNPAASGDGCSETCQIEAGFDCAGQPSVCTPICGDGLVRGAETCDDGQAVPVDGDGCSATCTEEDGFDCTGEPSICVTVCGDGFVTFDEQCDDGNDDETDGCTTACLDGVVCATTVATLTTGDGFAVDALTGTCYVAFDEEETTFDDAQTACIAAGGHLVTITSAGEQTLVESVQNAGQNPWIGGSDTADEGTFAWVTGEAFSFTKFAPGQPDDDVGDGGNGDCLHLFNDDGEWNDTNCTIDTFVTSRICELALDTCGDGFLHTVNGEQCDDGNTTNGDGCSATCEVELLTVFTFTGAAGNEPTFAADVSNPNLDTTPVMSRGSGIGPSSAAGAFSSNGWTTATALDADDYYAFTVTAAAGFTMTLSSLELDESRSGTGIQSWSIRSSIDGFASDLAVFAVPDNTSFRRDNQVVLGAGFANLTAVEFRIYGYEAEAGTGTWRIDNVELAGFTVAN